MTTEVPSKSRVRKAGDQLKQHRRAGNPRLTGDDAARYAEAVAVAQQHRATFRTALTTVDMGMRSFARTVGCSDARHSTRLKRLDRIIGKLARPQAPSLERMQDIAGCRMVVPRAFMDPITEHLKRRWNPDRNGSNALQDMDDYVADPPPSGYRARHFIVLHRPTDRVVEVQLRSVMQNEWANLVEEFGRALGTELKAGEGPDVFLDFFAVLSEVMWLEEGGVAPDDQLAGRYAQLRAEVLHALVD